MQEFQWDEEKAEANRKKHGVSFHAASMVFADPGRLTLTDDRFDYDEEREITIGQVEGHILTVVHTDRGGKIRVISARYADPAEVRTYYQLFPQSE